MKSVDLFPCKCRFSIAVLLFISHFNPNDRNFNIIDSIKYTKTRFFMLQKLYLFYCKLKGFYLINPISPILLPTNVFLFYFKR